MAITLVGTAEGATIDNTDVTLTLPVGTAENDVVLVATAHAMTANPIGMVTAGYTELLDFASSTVIRISVNRKVMGATPDTTAVAVKSGDAARGTTAIAYVLRGVDTTTPEDATSVQATGTSGSPDSGSITTVTNGAWVFSFGAMQNSDTTITGPSGYGNQVDINAADAVPATIGGAQIEKASFGAENPGAWTTWASANWVAGTVALRPAVGGGGAAPTGPGRLLSDERNHLAMAA